MKAYIQSVIVALTLAITPAYGECAQLPELNIEELVQEAMNQIAEEIKSEIPGEVARLQEQLIESLKLDSKANKQSTETAE
ncbi:hypothetical protein [Endozoicomonas arenosclerae]|uniref:hypothetical protein n=1 Tax=Endozoicomonas arenosclerae TaxID=1633495 RepID=UPI000780E97E|nr:hypothetical protein [Endozoicomonas arenosclerae]